MPNDPLDTFFDAILEGMWKREYDALLAEEAFSGRKIKKLGFIASKNFENLSWNLGVKFDFTPVNNGPTTDEDRVYRKLMCDIEPHLEEPKGV